MTMDITGVVSAAVNTTHRLPAHPRVIEKVVGEDPAQDLRLGSTVGVVLLVLLLVRAVLRQILDVVAQYTVNMKGMRFVAAVMVNVIVGEGGVVVVLLGVEVDPPAAAGIVAEPLPADSQMGKVAKARIVAHPRYQKSRNLFSLTKTLDQIASKVS